MSIRNRHIFLLDVLVLLCTPALALVLRVDTQAFDPAYAISLLAFTIVALVVRLLVFYLCGMYQRMWRYIGMEDALALGCAVAGSTVILTLLNAWAQALPLTVPHLPRSVPVIDGMLTLFAVAGIRFAVRALYERIGNGHGPAATRKRTIIAGAGDAGALVVRELRQRGGAGRDIVGFCDDDPSKKNSRIYGAPVLGPISALRSLVREYRIEELIIAMPRAPGKKIRELVEACSAMDIEVRTLPRFQDIVSGQARVDTLREVDIEDLLRREPVETDLAAVAEMVRDRVVLVSGAGGSIGSELVRQIRQFEPRGLVLMGHGENSIFNIVNELTPARGTGPEEGAWIKPVIADTRSRSRLDSVFREFAPDVVFHAAAHKHVPLMEIHPSEAVSNNVIGTSNLVEAALAHGVQHFTLISTDKAVRPSSVMGATKRIAEYVVHEAAQRSGLPYVVLRFGNVLGSRGSVVQVFKRQIAQGGPVTVTDPRMKRYFMTIPEAVQLVLQAAVLGRGGEVFVLDMGEPISIDTLARDVIRLSGLKVGRDIDIVYSGIRGGEKLFEKLFTDGETYGRTEHEKLFVAENASTCLPDRLPANMALLREAAHTHDQDAVLEAMHLLVPSYEPIGTESVPEPVAEEAAAAEDAGASVWPAPVLDEEGTPT